MEINWFPGHMNKALDSLKKLKVIDLIIEVVDARAINASSNEQILNQFKKDTPILKIVLKEDLAIKKNNQNNLIYCNLKNNNARNIILKAINDKMKQKTEQYIKKGVLKPIYYIVVVGLPNIGKSSLINCLCNNKKVIVKNMPGVTRSNNIVKLNDMFFLYDTPGIMFKKITSNTIGYILVLINVINPNVVNLNIVLEWWFNFTIKNYHEIISNYFGYKNNDENFNDFVEYIKNKYLTNTIERTYNFIFQKIINGDIGKINYEA